MNYKNKFQRRVEKPPIIEKDQLVMEYQKLAVFGSRLAMAILSDVSIDDLKKLAYDYNQAYVNVLSPSKKDSYRD